MKYLSVCSGIEAATVAWSGLGWKASGFSEIEPFPSKVLKHHYPDVPNHGDMTLLPEKIRAGTIEAPDLLCGGTPCQAFSVAGLRRSLDDDRGNLTLKFCEIADAIDETRSVPSIIFWENVPGVLNTKDNAFGCFLGALAGENAPLIPPGGRWSNAGFVDGSKRAIAWRVLDAQYFGVAQRRRRVFVIASARDDFDPASVLFEFEGVRRDSPPSRKAGQAIAPSVTTGPPFSRTGNDRVETDAIVATRMVAFGEYIDDGAASAIKATDYKDATDLVMQSIGIDYEYNAHGVDQPTGPLLKGSPSGGGHPLPAVMQPINIYGGNKRSDRPEGGFYVRMDEDTSKTLDAASGLNPTCSQGGTAVIQGGNPLPAIASSMAVRRLTPRECERLQGFPDDYTAIPNALDGARYKALGNSWAVPVVKWIGERIARALD